MRRRPHIVAARSRLLRLRAEDGQSIAELAIAMSVLSIAVLGVIGSMGLGMTLTGGSRQRSTGSAVANERLERARNTPYSRVATYEQPQYTAGTPDANVSSDGTTYTLSDGTKEPLIVDSLNGAFKHIDDPTTVGVTQFQVYQYVTWVDDPQIPGTQNYKRFTVVVVWKFPVSSATTQSLTESTFISDGTVSLPNATPTIGPTSSPASPSPSATPVPTPTPTPAEACSGDTTGPTGSMVIQSATQNGSTLYTNSTSGQFSLTATDSCAPITGWLTDANGNSSAHWGLTSGLTSTNLTWILTGGDGTKSITTHFTDGVGNATTLAAVSLVLDTVKPTTPGTPVYSPSQCTITGNGSNSTRTVTFSWNPSTDTNFLGYRVFRNGSVISGSNTTPSTQWTDSSAGNTGPSYTVVAYDKAGNSSAVSGPLSFKSNKC